ncbi:Protein YceI [Ruegeria sp. THAF57]|uniref:YceI family protein n=1 Tax=Ruegeria sp. THAF57 TaxID=2744555 RepID=UPI0015DDFF89|nr:YceI family protein [Ruegeria sp. THAF57]CAD0183237.1 Protein YceI [Ruegeria sp. THAF57]
MTILSRRTLLGGLVTLPMVRPALAALQPYELLKDGTSVDFTFALSGITQSGTMPIQSADIQIDLRNLPNSRVAVVLSVAEARTKVPFARKPMLSESVLDAGAFPTIQFESTSILLGEGGRISHGAMVVGDLTLRGVTRPIALQANLFRERGSDTGNLDDLSINLTGALNRHDFGASGYADLVQDTVGLDIQARIKRIG